MAATPASVVIANHCYGLFELAAVYLSQMPPVLDEAKVAIDKSIELMAKPDHQALGLRGAIEEAIKERDVKKAEPTPAPAQDNKV